MRLTLSQATERADRNAATYGVPYQVWLAGDKLYVAVRPPRGRPALIPRSATLEYETDWLD